MYLGSNNSICSLLMLFVQYVSSCTPVKLPWAEEVVLINSDIL